MFAAKNKMKKKSFEKYQKVEKVSEFQICSVNRKTVLVPETRHYAESAAESHFWRWPLEETTCSSR